MRVGAAPERRERLAVVRPVDLVATEIHQVQLCGGRRSTDGRLNGCLASCESRRHRPRTVSRPLRPAEDGAGESGRIVVVRKIAERKCDRIFAYSNYLALLGHGTDPPRAGPIVFQHRTDIRQEFQPHLLKRRPYLGMCQMVRCASARPGNNWEHFTPVELPAACER